MVNLSEAGSLVSDMPGLPLMGEDSWIWLSSYGLMLNMITFRFSKYIVDNFYYIFLIVYRFTNYASILYWSYVQPCAMCASNNMLA